MISIKLQNESGKIKYIKRPDDYPVEIGGCIRMRWQIEWKVLSIKKIKNQITEIQKKCSHDWKYMELTKSFWCCLCNKIEFEKEKS